MKQNALERKSARRVCASDLIHRMQEVSSATAQRDGKCQRAPATAPHELEPNPLPGGYPDGQAHKGRDRVTDRSGSRRPAFPDTNPDAGSNISALSLYAAMHLIVGGVLHVLTPQEATAVGTTQAKVSTQSR